MDQSGSNEPSKLNHPNWGGKRPGAGAPKGNLNAWRHGRNSRYSLQLAEFLATVPAAQDAMLKLSKRRKKREAQTHGAAAELMSEICRRVGEAILSAPPAHGEERGTEWSSILNNHLENNQEFLALLNRAQALFAQFAAQQSSEAAK